MKKLLFSSVLLFVFVIGYAQYPSKVEVSKPRFCGEVEGNPRGIKKEQQWQDWCMEQINGMSWKSTGKYWEAYSDRAYNATYSDATEYSSPQDELSLGDKVYIARIKNGMALVYTSDYKQENYPNIKNPEWKGWVPLQNLVLWSQCPRSRSSIIMKGLVAHDPKKGTSVEMSPNFRLQPVENSDERNGYAAKELEIYYIFKTTIDENGREHYLLANDIVFSEDGKDVGDKMLGWLSDEYIQKWDQRLCLEPTFAKRSVDVYKSIGVYPAFFMTKSYAKKMYTNGSIESPTWQYQDEFSTQRMKAKEMRIPLIDKMDKNNSDIFYSVYYARLANSNNSRDNIEKLKEQKKHVNIVFVIDHTQSMTKYFAPVAHALTDLMERDYKTKIRVGAVLFKDYADNPVCRTIKLTDDIRSVSRQLSNAASTTGSVDRDHWEAMFEGLNQALNASKMGYNSEESNFIVLIGDAGDHPSRNGENWTMKVDELAQKMKDLNVNFLGYQINNDGSDAARDWGSQVIRMQKKYSELYNNQVQSNEYKYILSSSRWYELKNVNGGDGARYITYQYAPKGRNTSEEGLKRIVSNSIDSYIRYVEKELKIRSINDLSDDTASGKANESSLREVLESDGFTSIEIDDYIKYLKEGGASKFLGYTPRKVEGYKENLFEYVVFFSEPELVGLIRELDKINSPSGPSKAKSLQDALLSMGVAMLGQNAEQIGNLDMDDLMRQIFGVPVKISTCGYNIKNIIHMNDSEVECIINEFNHKLTKLKNIRNSSYNGRFSRNGTTYYWIPVSDIPGFCVK